MKHLAIVELCLKTRWSEDETEKELLEDMIKCALKYTQFRVEWNFWGPVERDANNNYRTSCHNRFIDALNIFLRYERGLGKEVTDISGYDRKTIGDIANELICAFAIAQR